MKQTLPGRLRESSFRTFEDDIAAIVNQWPCAVPFTDFHGLSINTFSARLRDSLTSFHQFHWPSDKVSYADFCVIRERIIVKQLSSGKVLAGSKEEVDAVAEQEPMVDPLEEVRGSSVAIVFEVTDAVEKRLLARLAALRVFKQPLILRGLTPDDVATLEDSYDVIFHSNTDGTYTL